MQTKPLLYGLIGFFIGGLIVSTAASMNDKPSEQTNNQADNMSMSEMTNSLRNKTSDDYDKAFISYMIDHHQSAVDMAELSADRAKHREIKDLSKAIVSAQEKEISEMRKWQKDWGYNANLSGGHSAH